MRYTLFFKGSIVLPPIIKCIVLSSETSFSEFFLRVSEVCIRHLLDEEEPPKVQSTLFHHDAKQNLQIDPSQSLFQGLQSNSQGKSKDVLWNYIQPKKR